MAQPVLHEAQFGAASQAANLPILIGKLFGFKPKNRIGRPAPQGW